jgi:hypothetical protein
MKSLNILNNSIETYKRVRTLEDISHCADYDMMCTILLKWQKLKPDNEEVNEMASALGRMFIYIHNLQSFRDCSEHSWEKFREAKLNAIMESREITKKNKELEDEIKRLKILTNL